MKFKLTSSGLFFFAALVCCIWSCKLQELYTTYADQGLRILAFPSNQFGGQEPGTNEEIKHFAVEKYKVSFDLFDKVDVNGPNAHPIFVYLQESLSGFVTKWV
ncbi:unnamed protein product [Dibothriocephalus latus]|uniref:Glutathione peroxidase n=1 Tax=Dibothriocephalus latus TaxID=60516 RepID=A0A3P7N700_DIBLA|nr:unnamed protein product [Dibothriocephalus latus]